MLNKSMHHFTVLAKCTRNASCPTTPYSAHRRGTGKSNRRVVFSILSIIAYFVGLLPPCISPLLFFFFDLGNAKIRYMMAPESRESKAHPQFEREASSDLSVYPSAPLCDMRQLCMKCVHCDMLAVLSYITVVVGPVV